jgi:hypothetical protein
LAEEYGGGKADCIFEITFSLPFFDGVEAKEKGWGKGSAIILAL